MSGYGQEISQGIMQSADDAMAHKRQRKEQLSDEQRQEREQFLLNEYAQGKISDPSVIQRGIDDLYAHEPDESRLGRLGRFLAKAVHLKKGNAAPAGPAPSAAYQTPSLKVGETEIPGETKTVTGPAPKTHAEDFHNIVGGAKTSEQVGTERQDALQKRIARIQGDTRLTPEEKDQQMSVLGVKSPAPVKQQMDLLSGTVNGKQVSWLKNKYDGSITDLAGNDVPDDQKQAFVPTPKTQPKTPQMKPGVSGGKNVFAYYNTDKNSWIDSNTAQPLSDFRPAPSFAQTGLWGLDVGYDDQGNTKPVLLNRRTGEVKNAPAGIVAPGQTKDIEKQRTTAIQSDSLLRTMLESAKEAHSGNQQAMLALLASHLGMTMGAQKGTRISQAQFNEAIHSAPWSQTIVAKWFHPAEDGSGDMIFDGYKSGVTLTPQQIEQMVMLGKQRRQILWQQFADTAQANGVQMDIPEFKEKGAAPAPRSKSAPGGGGAHKVGEVKKFANGKSGVWDGQGWVAQ